MKVCPKCERELDLGFFSRNARAKDGYCSWCRECTANRRKERWTNEPGYAERERAKGRRRYNPERERAKGLAQYDLTIAEYDEMLAAQGGACAICQRKPKKSGPRLAVDHEHRTGLVRGLLCGNCNWNLIGAFHENARLFARAAGYLDFPPALDVFRPPKRHRKAPPQTAEEARAIMEEQQ